MESQGEKRLHDYDPAAEFEQLAKYGYRLTESFHADNEPERKFGPSFKFD